MTRMLIAAGLVSFLAIGSAHAAGDKGKKKGDVFTQLDKDKDGFLSREEFKAIAEKKGGGKDTDKAFTKLDKDGDGKLSKDEFAAAKNGKKKKDK